MENIQAWTDKEIESIKEEISIMLIEEINGGKIDIFNKILKMYPQDTSVSVRSAYRDFSKIYYKVQQEIIEEADVEKSLLVPKSIERYEWLYNKAISEKRYRDAKAVVDSLVKIIGVDKMQQLIKEDQNGELSFHLDFGL